MPALAREPEPLRLRLAAPAQPAQLVRVRGRIAAWAEAVGLDSDTVDDVVLATHEALANVVDHAYPDKNGEAFVDAECTGDEVIVIVRDHGRWQPLAANPGWRGRGLVIIHGLAERARVQHRETGTTVEMRWPLPRAAAGWATSARLRRRQS